MKPLGLLLFTLTLGMQQDGIKEVKAPLWPPATGSSLEWSWVQKPNGPTPIRLQIVYAANVVCTVQFTVYEHDYDLKLPEIVAAMTEAAVDANPSCEINQTKIDADRGGIGMTGFTKDNLEFKISEDGGGLKQVPKDAKLRLDCGLAVQQMR